MRTQHTLCPVSLRFRRWSRKAYAAFISIQRAVTMGCLTCSVVERFQQKNQSVHTTACAVTNKNGKEDEVVEEELQVLVMSLQAVSLLAVQPNTLPAPAYPIYKQIK